MKRIKSGDTVVVICGKSKGHVGKVRKALGRKVIVEGANVYKKHMKPIPQLNKQGGIVSKEMPMDVSNVAAYNPVTKKADKIGFRYVESDGKTHKVRYFKSNNELVDIK